MAKPTLDLQSAGVPQRVMVIERSLNIAPHERSELAVPAAKCSF